MRRRPPWKAESARIRAEITARKKHAIPIEAKAITIRTEYPITLETSVIDETAPWKELDPCYVAFYRRIVSEQIFSKLQEEDLIRIERINLPGGIKEWRATLRVVI